MPPLPWNWPCAEGLPKSAGIHCYRNGYISTSNIEDEEDEDIDEEDDEVLGEEDTVAYRNIIV